MIRYFFIGYLLVTSSVSSFGQDISAADKVFSKPIYEEQKYARYEGVFKKDENTYQFGDRIIKISVSGSAYVKLFELGVFNPEVIFGPVMSKEEKARLDKGNIELLEVLNTDCLEICCIEELKELSPNRKTKRFVCWVFSEGVANPKEYYFELYNGKARKNTNLDTFINDAQLTFYYRGSVIL